MQEKNVVLDVSKRFKALLDADTADTKGGGKWVSLMTRSTDVFVSLAGRSAYSNNQGADRFMSIHSNAFGNATANGTETFAFSEGGEGAKLRNLVQAEMLAAWKLTNRGNKTENFAVLRETACPAILHELAFITNATDAAKLGSPAERQKAAEAHLRAIQRHYNITPYIPGTTTTPPQDTDGEIAGHVTDGSGPVVGATVKLDGGASVLTDADGAFEFTKVKAGEHKVSASADGYAPKTADVAVAASARAEVELVLEPGSDDGEGPGDDGGDGDPDGESSGCNTGKGTGSLAMLLALGLLVNRRRRA